MDQNEWYKIASYASKSYINMSIIEANYKILHRWYIVLTGFCPRGLHAMFSRLWSGGYTLLCLVDTSESKVLLDMYLQFYLLLAPNKPQKILTTSFIGLSCA